MTVIGDKFKEAIEAKSNDIKSYVWKLARNSDRTQQEIRMVDATPEQLNTFYQHCISMLYNQEKMNPGRYTLLEIIQDQRGKCNAELFLRKLEDGSICADHKPYPRFLYLQDIMSYMNAHRDKFPTKELSNIPITEVTGGLPREFERISITQVKDACLGQLGFFDNKHITFSFILSLGVYLTPQELKEFDEKDANGISRSKLEVIKERLGINKDIRLVVKPSGLNFTELRAMLNLKNKKYTDFTTDQLVTLRNKVLFRLENEVNYHISQWEERKAQIEKVAEAKGIKLSV